MSIANKIYTFPRNITALSDILSSDEEEPSPRVLVQKKDNANRQVIDLKAFRKKNTKTKEVDTSRQFDSQR